MHVMRLGQFGSSQDVLEQTDTMYSNARWDTAQTTTHMIINLLKSKQGNTGKEAGLPKEYGRQAGTAKTNNRVIQKDRQQNAAETG